MKMKKLFAFLLLSSLLVSFCACAGTETPGSSDSVAEGPYAKASDETVISLLTTAYADELKKDARTANYSFSVTEDGDLRKSAVGFYAYKGVDFSAEREVTNLLEDTKVKTRCVYTGGVMYVSSGEGYVPSEMTADAAFNELHLQGIALDMLAPDVILPQSLTRHDDGSFTVNAVLTDAVETTVIGDLLNEVGLSLPVENCTLNVYLDGTVNGELETIRHEVLADVAAGETTIRHRVETRVKFLSSDGNSIKIEAPAGE